MAAPALPSPFSFDAYHAEALPASLADRDSRLPAYYARTLPPLGLRERESGAAYTYVCDVERGRIELRPGLDAAASAIDLPSEQFVQLTEDLESAAGLVYGERAECLKGELMDLLQWEPALRWLYRDRPVYDPASVDLRDAKGRVLDPTRGFEPDDDPAEMAEFLRVVGYLWVRHVIPPDEIETLRAASDRLRAAAREGDQESWWGRNASGDAVLCRVLRAGKEPAMAALHGDPRLERFAELCDAPMAHKQGPTDKDGVTVLWKQPGIEEGLGDLPWHRDCGMGGHASMCPTAVLSLFLGPNRAEAGSIRFLPGSWQSSFPFADARSSDAPEGVAPPAEPGDITFHYGDGLHYAPPPTGTTGPFRRCVLMGYGRVGGGHHRGERHYNDVLLGSEDGQVKDMRAVAARRSTS